ncbi:MULTISPECIES: hypothetical protein [unclassified Streptomyces]|uniref:hypothetical protein n=1 Tax=unclassified Streptomyces TaxID=2593676 RepID=UPI0037FDC782
MEIWSVVDDADRARWTLVPFTSVGPLRFGMSPEDATAVMDAGGFEAEPDIPFRHGPLTQRVHYRVKGGTSISSRPPPTSGSRAHWPPSRSTPFAGRR